MPSPLSRQQDKPYIADKSGGGAVALGGFAQNHCFAALSPTRLTHRINGGTNMEADSKPATASGEAKAVEKKWTKPLADAGWTALPNVIFERQHALGLDPLDINIILHLAGYWWKAGNDPYPSKATIAAAIGVDPRTVQRRIARLEAAGFVARKARSSKKNGTLSNQYSFAGLIKAATPFAHERVEEKKKRMAEATERAKRKKPQLTVIK